MKLHLFSLPGDPGLRSIVDAARPYLEASQEPLVAYLPAEPREGRWLRYAEQAFAGLGRVVLLDCERAGDAEIDNILDRASLLYIPGGNTYRLRVLLERQGLLERLAQRVRAGLPLVGFSAGAVICGQHIRASNDPRPQQDGAADPIQPRSSGDSEQLAGGAGGLALTPALSTPISAGEDRARSQPAPDQYDDQPAGGTSGLALAPYAFNVHYPLESEEQRRRDEWLAGLLEQDATPIIALQDGAYLYGSMTMLRVGRGDCWLFERKIERRRLATGEPIPISH